MPELDDARILITGATGSFGKAFVRRVLQSYRLRRLVVFSRDELKQSDMALEFPGADHTCLRYFIGDVRDRDRLEMAMQGIDVVIHAAALKQVPTAEYNPFECIQTNVVGAENVVHAAIRARVSRVLALSTDKAVSPINLYGASKLAADKIFTAGNHLSGERGPRFSVVRYGNVLDSRGSVVPLFRRLRDEGATHLPITDERMTRFWITLPQAVDCVLSCLQVMHGGEIFVPKIPSMRIVDLANAIAPDMALHVVGIRPGEKLHEALITKDDARNTLDLGDRYVIEPSFAMWERASYRDNGGKPMDEEFSYTSDTNDQWLDVSEIASLLMETGVV